MSKFHISALSTAIGLTLLSTAATAPAATSDATAVRRVEISGHAESNGWIREGDALVPNVPFRSLRTRAEVQAELRASQAAREWVFAGDEWIRRDGFVSTKSRADVMAEAAASRMRGDYVQVGDEMVHRSMTTQLKLLSRSAENEAHLAAAPSAYAAH